MVVKTFQHEGRTIQYTVSARSRTYQFVDHTGRDVEMNHLGFFDIDWTLNVMGFTDRGQIVDWFEANKHKIKERTRTEVFTQNINKYFDQDACFLHEVGRYVNRSDPPFFFYDSSPSRVRVSFVLCDTEEVQQEPTYEVSSFNWGNTVYYKRVTEESSSTSEPETTLWTKKWNYSKKMNDEEFTFFRTLPRESTDVPFYGMELELSTELGCKELQHIVTEVEPKQEPFFIMKEDSSVNGSYSNRVELVSVPCSRRYLRKAWSTFFKKIEVLCAQKDKEVGDYFDMSDSLNNGLHIHISKDKFFNDYHKRRFLTAFNQWDKTNSDMFQKVSRRPSKYKDNRYCAVDHNFDGRTLARRLKKGHRTSGRSVCHDSNSATVEVRLYQGIFDLKHVLTCLDHIDAMYDFTEGVGLSSFGRSFSSKFEEFVMKNFKHRSLVSFLKGDM